MMWIGICLVVPLLWLLILSRRDEARVRKNWSNLVNEQDGQEQARSATSAASASLAQADAAFDEAFQLQSLGSNDEARELLKEGYGAIERFAPSFLSLLASMTVYSRMVSAMAPVAPLSASSFRLTPVRSLATLASVLHHLLVTAHERFRLRVFVLRQAFGLARRYLWRATRRVISGQAAKEAREWQQINDARSDFGSILTETAATLRALVVSMPRERADQLIELIEDPSAATKTYVKSPAKSPEATGAPVEVSATRP